MIFNFLFVLAFFVSSSREVILAVHRCTAGKLVKSYAENFGKFFKQKGTKAAKNPFGYTRAYLCFVRCLLFKTKVVSASCRCNGREATAGLSNQHAPRVSPRVYFSTTGCFASSTSFSKRGSPRSGSQNGISFRLP